MIIIDKKIYINMPILGGINLYKWNLIGVKDKTKLADTNYIECYKFENGQYIQLKENDNLEIGIGYMVKEINEPHQLKWFSTELLPNENNNYPDPYMEITYENDNINIISNGIPTFEFILTTPNNLNEQNFNWNIPRTPIVNNDKELIPLLGAIGFTTTGLPLYGPNEAARPHPYGDPAIQGILDYCHGHTGGLGDYHFHAAPECLIEHPDGSSEHFNIIAFALDGFPIIAHYKSLVDKNGDIIYKDIEKTKAEFDWLETSGYYPSDTYKENVIDGNNDSNYVWSHYGIGRRQNTVGGGYNSELGTLDECNGRSLKTDKTIIDSHGDKVSEKDFFQFEYAYFITKKFPYFLAKYNGIINSNGNNNSDCSGHGVTWGPGIGPPPEGCGGPNRNSKN